MKLYVLNNSGEKKYLEETAPSKLVLYHKLGEKVHVGEEEYPIDKVMAEPSSNSSVTGLVSGGLVGALAGPIGVLIGIGVGILIGSGVQNEEYIEVNKFNESVFNSDEIKETV